MPISFKIKNIRHFISLIHKYHNQCFSLITFTLFILVLFSGKFKCFFSIIINKGWMIHFLDLDLWMAEDIPCKQTNYSSTIHTSSLNRILTDSTNLKFISSENPPALWYALISFSGSPLWSKPWFTWTHTNWWAITLIKRATTTKEIHSFWKCEKKLSYLLPVL